MNESKEVFVGNLPYDLVPSDLETFFKDLSIADIRLVHDRQTNQFRGFAYVSFNDAESAEKAVSANGFDYLGRKLRIDFAKDRSSNRNSRNPHSSQSHSRDRPQRSIVQSWNRSNAEYGHEMAHPAIPDSPPFTLYIGNLNPGVETEFVQSLFKDIPAQEVRLLKDHEGVTKGVGFVEFATKQNLIAALELDGNMVDGNEIRCSVAKNRERREKSEFKPRQRRQPRPEEFEKAERPASLKLNLKPRTKPLEQVGRAAVKTGKADPFGGAKPRDEFAYQKQKEARNKK
eukprot:augustus_masked-scaffold_22-processed-gene-0.8-mRNA-1 protein AED:0.36 eAED:0.36 QI:0/-1/0/1/-1/1/1/0/286